MWLTLLWTGLGGACGASSRLLVSKLMKAWLGGHLPWGTFTVNMIGSLCMGFLFALTQKQILTNEHAKFFLLVGFLGSFTTFSSFALDNVYLMEAGSKLRPLMLLNIGVQNTLGVVLVLVGFWLAKFV